MTVCCCALSVKANTLLGRVIAVHDGQTITIENTGRPIKVALKLAVPPAQDQPYADVARQHLSDLVLNRQVTIEFTRLGDGNLLTARIFCDQRDIGLQMIRDGVAWFDRSYINDLSEPERRVYADSEQAARNEHRGIWRDLSPTPPWEWKQANSNILNKRSGALTIPAKSSTVVNEASSGKTSRSYPTSSHTSPVSNKSEVPGWLLFSPADNSFSIRVPGAGQQFSVEIDDSESQPIIGNVYAVQHLKIAYIALWASGPSEDETISAIFDRGYRLLNESARANGLPCEYVQEKDTAMKGYAGRRYKITGCYFNGGLRVYFKKEGKTLRMHLVGAMSQTPHDPLVSKFLNSFVIN
jgi:endonuclease YncB( thermonuclease family)